MYLHPTSKPLGPLDVFCVCSLPTKDILCRCFLSRWGGGGAKICWRRECRIEIVWQHSQPPHDLPHPPLRMFEAGLVFAVRSKCCFNRMLITLCLVQPEGKPEAAKSWLWVLFVLLLLLFLGPFFLTTINPEQYCQASTSLHSLDLKLRCHESHRRHGDDRGRDGLCNLMLNDKRTLNQNVLLHYMYVCIVQVLIGFARTADLPEIFQTPPPP